MVFRYQGKHEDDVGKFLQEGLRLIASVGVDL